MPRFCIINGDDFGASAGVNRGIVEAHCDGVLTSASLMVNRPGAAEAARLSRDLPQMSVGLHCALTAEDSTALVDFDSPSDCRAEIAAQWVRFVD
ncbi:MAG TPA: ChbG/HpnK family deacetylase, partial [Vicinamibacterales bacterium]|nr:ChbG/HpnK family deacetylase [Vicinamibacterales bacterium]